MKIGRIVSLLTFVLVGGQSHAKVPGSLVPLGIGKNRYVTQGFPPSLLMRALAEGYPLVGTLKGEEKKEKKEEAVSAPTDRDSLSAAIEQTNSHLAAIKAATEKSENGTRAAVQALNSWKRDFSGPRALSPRSHTPTRGAADTASRTPALDRHAFVACALRTPPPLEEEALTEDETPIKIEVFLYQERGDGFQISPSGIACGRYLGKFGFIPKTKADEIKWLSALASVPPAKAELLWLYFTLFGKNSRQETVSAAHFWDYAWKRAVFSVVFCNGQTAPALETLIEDYRSAFSNLETKQVSDTTLNVVISDFKALRIAIQSDWTEVREELK